MDPATVLESTSRRRGRRLLIVLVIAWLVFNLVALGLTARFFLWPQSDQPRRVDAVVVLSGDYGGRLPEGRRLIATSPDAVLVHAGTPDGPGAKELCAGGSPLKVICLQPEPDSTRAEARAVGQLAKQRGWHTIAVVTSTYHTTRAALLFRRCFQGQVHMVAIVDHISPSLRLRQVVHEWEGSLYALVVARSC